MSVGERVAFGEYVRARSGALLRAAQALTANRADAEDLVQATLMKAYQAWERISDLAAVDTYVRRAMVNTHISGWRAAARRRVPDRRDPRPARRGPGDSDLHDVVQRALDRLPRQMRAAVMLRYYDDMTEPQVAAAMGITVGTVKSTVARAVGKLRDDEQLARTSSLPGAFRGSPRRPRSDRELSGLALKRVRHGTIPGVVSGEHPKVEARSLWKAR